MVTINKEWLEEVNNKADLYENNRIGILDFSNDELQYLIYWNFGVSGAWETDYSRNARAELIARGLEYSQARAEEIDALAEQYY